MTTLAPYYQDDLVTIYCGDSREILPLLSTCDNDTMVTDPPYGYAYASNMGGKFKGQQIANDEDTTARDEVLAMWGDRPALVFGSWKRARPERAKALLIWDKIGGGGLGMGDLSIPWGNTFEEVYVLGTGWLGTRGPAVLRYPRAATGAMEHPNEKPVPLMRDLIAKCPGTIVDPFMGSGSTLRAAKDMGRQAIGIEVDPKWCALAARRLSQENLFPEEVAS